MPKGIYKKSEEQKRRISEALKGIPQPWNKGSKHGLWKGKKVEYTALHAWVRRNWGKADKCENFACSKKTRRFEWANKNHKYKRNLEDWIQLCPQCHKFYDMGKLNLSK